MGRRQINRRRLRAREARPNKKFDHDEYDKSLMIILEHTATEYKRTAIDIPASQKSNLKTYLWLSSLLIAAELSIFKALLEKKVEIPFFQKSAGPWFYIFAIVSLGMSAVCFFLGVDSMRGRKPKYLPFGDPMSWADKAYADAEGENALVKTQTSVIGALSYAISESCAIVNILGIKLRIMSVTLLVSLVFFALAIVSYAWF